MRIKKLTCAKCGRAIEEADTDVMWASVSPTQVGPLCIDCFNAWWKKINEGRDELERDHERKQTIDCK